ncbi:MAG TPA: papain-like cysteine protease family protein [Thermoanaerobaculia bacterium]|nr:papain-like cysteine protease family protein [Thermoanaerobaculia bacterium]
MSLDLRIEQQQKSLWCWVAVSVSVKRFYTTATIHQCEQASSQNDGKPCCDDPDACNVKDGYLMAALQRLGVFRQLVEDSVPFELLAAEIAQKRPVCCRIEWRDRTGHFVCIDGYDGRALFVKDPWDGAFLRVPYDEFKTRYRGSGRWTHTYLTTP